MNSSDLKKVLKSIECCSDTTMDSPCYECPYRTDDNDLSCIDKRHDDLLKILDWGIETMETLEHFLNGK